MEFKKFRDRYVIRLDKSEEIISTVKAFCKKQGVALGWITGIGAVNRAKIGLSDTAKKEYHSKILEGDFEITSLMGNISTMDGEVYLHLHINLADGEHKTWGGHLNEAIISATGELIIERIEGDVEREFSEEIGLNLYKFT